MNEFGRTIFERYVEQGLNYTQVEYTKEADIRRFVPNETKSVDFFVNISSLHEMRIDQISYYFYEIYRLTRKYFYFKQWKETTIPLENETVTEADYPVRDDWRLINRQQCKVQTYFFEALYELPGKNSNDSVLESP